MASSSSGAILSMSAWFSRLNTQQQGREGRVGGREGGSQARKRQRKERELCLQRAAASDVRFSTELLLAYNSKLQQV